MKNSILNLIATFALLAWPIFFMFSPMVFDAPGSTSNKLLVAGMIVFLYYPSMIFLIYSLVGWKYYFGISGKTLLVPSLTLISVGLWTFGYFNLLSGAIKGIRSFGYSVAQDKVYYSAKEIEDADPASFKILGKDDYGADKTHVYHDRQILEGVNPSNFQQIKTKDDAFSDYWSDGESIYYFGKKVNGVDVESFLPIDRDRANDKNNHYLGERPLDADYDSFRWLEYTYFGYLGRDKDRLYINAEVVPAKIDMSTFEMSADYPGCAKDSSNVYLLMGRHTRPIESADVKTFTKAQSNGNSRGYYVDKNHVYFFSNQNPVDPRNGRLEGVNPSSFIVTGYNEANESDANDGIHFFLNGEPSKN